MQGAYLIKDKIMLLIRIIHPYVINTCRDDPHNVITTKYKMCIQRHCSFKIFPLIDEKVEGDSCQSKGNLASVGSEFVRNAGT